MSWLTLVKDFPPFIKERASLKPPPRVSAMVYALFISAAVASRVISAGNVRGV